MGWQVCVGIKIKKEKKNIYVIEKNIKVVFL